MSAVSFLSGALIEKEIADEVAFKAFQGEIARAAADEAKRLAPGEQDRYVVAGEDWFGSNYTFWHLVEFGSVNNPAYASLRRATGNIGLRLDVAPKP